MIISVAKSDYFMDRARQICLYRPPKTTASTADNYFLHSFIDAYIMSATALEAFINERISINIIVYRQRISMNLHDPVEENQKRVLEMLKEQDLITKYRMMPILLWNRNFDEGRSPFQDFVTLVGIRNDIIHYKMTFYDEQNKQPKWVNRLKAKGVFLPQPVTHDTHRIWIDEICTLKGAKWAYNTSYAMINKFYELSEGITKGSCEGWVESLKKI